MNIESASPTNVAQPARPEAPLTPAPITFQAQMAPTHAAVASPVVLYSPASFRTLFGWALGLNIASTVLGIGMNISVVLAYLTLVTGIPAVVINSILLYRVWKQIEYPRVSPSAGTAVGLMFVPFFNFYWVFVAWAGAARRLNGHVSSAAIASPRVSEGLAVWSSVLWLVGFLFGWVWFLGMLLAIVHTVFHLMYLSQITRTSALIAEYLRRNPPPNAVLLP